MRLRVNRSKYQVRVCVALPSQGSTTLSADRLCTAFRTQASPAISCRHEALHPIPPDLGPHGDPSLPVLWHRRDCQRFTPLVSGLLSFSLRGTSPRCGVMLTACAKLPLPHGYRPKINTCQSILQAVYCKYFVSRQLTFILRISNQTYNLLYWSNR